jgi:catechol 2,3-dioxygenase-like lactoylglutathione lyase family enzyme
MIKLNHLTIPVEDCSLAREWYVRNLGLKVEFEIPERKTVALVDDSDLTLFLVERPSGEFTASCTLAFEVDDVELKYRELSDRGIVFEKSPQKLFWGYGAELRDPSGYLIYLWDERTMREKGA